MKRYSAIICLPLLLAFVAFSQIKVQRKIKLNSYQTELTSLSGCVSSPCVATTNEAYLGTKDPSAPTAGQIANGSVGSITITIKAIGTTFTAANAWTITANQTYNLAGIVGAWMPGGFTLTCSDSSSGTACAAAMADLFWSE